MMNMVGSETIVQKWEELFMEPFDSARNKDIAVMLTEHCFASLFQSVVDSNQKMTIALDLMNRFLDRFPDIIKYDKLAFNGDMNLAEMALAAGLHSNLPDSSDMDVVLHAGLLVLLLWRRDKKTTEALHFYGSTSEFLEQYCQYREESTRFQDLKDDDDEASLLRLFGNLMIVARGISPQKEYILNLCTSVCEGIDYSISSLKEPLTSRKLKIFENEIGSRLRAKNISRSPPLIATEPVSSSTSASASSSSSQSSWLSKSFLMTIACHGDRYPGRPYLEGMKEFLASMGKKGLHIHEIQKDYAHSAFEKQIGPKKVFRICKLYLETIRLTADDGMFLEAGSVRRVVQSSDGQRISDQIIQNVICCNKQMANAIDHLAAIDTIEELEMLVDWLPPAVDSQNVEGSEESTIGNSSSSNDGFNFRSTSFANFELDVSLFSWKNSFGINTIDAEKSKSSTASTESAKSGESVLNQSIFLVNAKRYQAANRAFVHLLKCRAPSRAGFLSSEDIIALNLLKGPNVGTAPDAGDIDALSTSTPMGTGFRLDKENSIRSPPPPAPKTIAGLLSEHTDVEDIYLISHLFKKPPEEDAIVQPNAPIQKPPRKRPAREPREVTSISMRSAYSQVQIPSQQFEGSRSLPSLLNYQPNPFNSVPSHLCAVYGNPPPYIYQQPLGYWGLGALSSTDISPLNGIASSTALAEGNSDAVSALLSLREASSRANHAK